MCVLVLGASMISECGICAVSIKVLCIPDKQNDHKITKLTKHNIYSKIQTNLQNSQTFTPVLSISTVNYFFFLFLAYFYINLPMVCIQKCKKWLAKQDFRRQCVQKSNNCTLICRFIFPFIFSFFLSFCVCFNQTKHTTAERK